jgi:homeodomain-containing protein
MIYVRQPTHEEWEELPRMRRGEIGRVSQRAHRVLRSVGHPPCPSLPRCTMFEVCRANVRYWLKRFNQSGPAGLDDETRSGRPRTVSEEVKSKMMELLRDDPQKEGYLATFWTVAMMLLVRVQTIGEKVSPSPLRRTLQHLGLRGADHAGPGRGKQIRKKLPNSGKSLKRLCKPPQRR